MPFPKTYRTALWWTVIASAAFALVAGKGTIPRISIVLILCSGVIGAHLVAWEHQWLKGWRKLFVIPIILLVATAFFFLVWPPHGISVTPDVVVYDPSDTKENYIFAI